MRKLLQIILTVFVMQAAVAWASSYEALPPMESLKYLPPGPEAIQQLEQRVRSQEKEMAIFKEVVTTRLNAQDKRISDLGLSIGQQANNIAGSTDQTTHLGNLILITAVLIILVSIITVFVVLKGTQRAIREARRAAESSAEKWFSTNSEKLTQNIKALQKEVGLTAHNIDEHKKVVAERTEQADKDIQEANLNFIQAIINLDNESYNFYADKDSINNIQLASESLKFKTESQFTASDYFARGLSELSERRFDSALIAFNHALKQQHPLMTPDLLLAKAITLGQLDQHEEELANYGLIEQRFSQDKDPFIRQVLAKALSNKGFVLAQREKHEEEIAVYSSIELYFGQDTSPTISEWLAKTLINKGFALSQLSRSEDEIKVYDVIDQRFGQKKQIFIRKQVLTALINKAFALRQLGRSEEELAVYNLIEQRFAQDKDAAIRKLLAIALLNRGGTLNQLQQYEAAIVTYDLVQQRFAQDKELAIQEILVTALVNKAIALGKLGRNSEEISTCDLVERHFGEETDPAIRELVAQALLNKSATLGQLGRMEELLEVCDLIEIRFSEAAETEIRELLVTALINKGLALSQLKRKNDAIATYRSIEQRFGEDSEPTILRLVAVASQNRNLIQNNQPLSQQEKPSTSKKNGSPKSPTPLPSNMWS
ncbi:hypothetical protein HZU77_012780 [Neisseriaceae bacterium TC5R-5]|nr:hypothetical protein [Neisseriaceae bacterium TC5R-5]